MCTDMHVRPGSSCGRDQQTESYSVGDPGASDSAGRSASHDRTDQHVVTFCTLDHYNFPTSPSIENKTNVDSQTENRHGITGYFYDKEVAKRIYEALVA